MSGSCASDTSDFSIYKSFSAAAVDDDLLPTKTHAFGYVGVDRTRKLVVGAFKGSNETSDFVTDLDGFEYLWSDCEIDGVNFGRVHSGFCNYYNDLSVMGFPEAFLDMIKANPTYTPLLIGHSLGATAAVLAAKDVNLKYGVTPVVYTYGQPRVGNYDFSFDFSTRVNNHYRVVHRADMVAHLPRACMVSMQSSKCPYHTWDEIWYDNDMNIADGDTYVECNGGEDSSCSKWIDLSISDHLSYFQIPIASYCC